MRFLPSEVRSSGSFTISAISKETHRKRAFITIREKYYLPSASLLTLRTKLGTFASTTKTVRAARHQEVGAMRAITIRISVIAHVPVRARREFCQAAPWRLREMGGAISVLYRTLSVCKLETSDVNAVELLLG